MLMVRYSELMHCKILWCLMLTFMHCLEVADVIISSTEPIALSLCVDYWSINCQHFAWFFIYCTFTETSTEIVYTCYCFWKQLPLRGCSQAGRCKKSAWINFQAFWPHWHSCVCCCWQFSCVCRGFVPQWVSKRVLWAFPTRFPMCTRSFDESNL